MSALPTKYVPIEFSVLGVAATIIAEMRSNDTVSSLWDRLADNPQVRTFDRFAAALTLLPGARAKLTDRSSSAVRAATVGATRQGAGRRRDRTMAAAHLDIADPGEEVESDVVVADLPAEQHPVGVADAGAERPVPRQRVRTVAVVNGTTRRVDAAGREHKRLPPEDLVLQLVGEHGEQPVVLGGEGAI